MGTLVDSYANQVIDLPKVYAASNIDGVTFECVAYSVESASRILTERGADCTTIHTIDWKSASEVTRDLYIDECKSARLLARSEALEHYGDTGSHVKVPALRSTRGLRGGDAS